MQLPQGFLLSGMHCGIKRKKLDLGLIYVKDYCQASAVFTTNANPAYSVTVSRANIAHPIKAVLVNSGNANCYSHKQGLADTWEVVSRLGRFLGVKKENILIASTGIIGKKLPKDKIIKNFPALVKNLSTTVKGFSQSILTTDTFAKISRAKVNSGLLKADILGFAKGAGMIFPNMATMLGFILTDAALPSDIFKKITRQAVEESFNSISIDGCMSTNDTVFFLSSAKVPLKSKGQITKFSLKLKAVCLDLAKMIVRDAEGATKFAQITVSGAKSHREAKTAGLALANSDLFRAALYGANANWGRIIAALGQAGIKVKENIFIKSNDLKKKEIKILVNLKRGKYSAIVYTSDLTPEYVKINAEYS